MPVANRSTINTAVAPNHSLPGVSWEAAPSSSTNGTITNGVGVAFNASVDISVGVGDDWLPGVCICIGTGVAVTVSVLGAVATGVVFGFGVRLTFDVVAAGGTGVSFGAGV